MHTDIAIILRFRDLVTESGGTVAEHRRIIRLRGYVWWGWWYRQAEHIPKGVLRELFPSESAVRMPILLFDSGALEIYCSYVTKIAAAPSIVGINSPEFEATPEYYVRGRYPLWFRLEGDITRLALSSVRILQRPTQGPAFDRLPVNRAPGEELSLEALRDDRPTLWLSDVVKGEGEC